MVGKLLSLLKQIKLQNIIAFIIIFAVACIISGFLYFSVQVGAYIDKDMHEQMEAIQENSVTIVKNELDYLKRITESVSSLMSQIDIATNEEIVATLVDYAQSANIVRTLFITVDGHTYSSYAGYMGKIDENTSFAGIALSDIKESFFSKPFYDEDLKKAIFGVISPTEIAGKKGVIVSSYNVSELLGLMKSALLDGSSSIGIVSSDGQVVVGETAEEFGVDIFSKLTQVEFSFSDVSTMQQELADGQKGMSAYLVGNVKHHCAYTPLDLNDWFVVTTVKDISLKENTAQLEKYGIQLTTNLVIIMFLMIIAISFLVYREQKLANAVLSRAATLDGLTGILNRATVEKLIADFFEKGIGIKKPALLVIDIDNFKLVNDTFGHVAGDEVLKNCAALLEEIFGEEGFVGRMGGDEFVVFIKSYGKKQRIEQLVEKFIDGLYVKIDGKEQRVSVSVGASWGKDISDFLELYKDADTALYKAKQNGKGRFFDCDADK